MAALSERGDRLAEAGNYNAAAARYREALALLPTPHSQWAATAWLYAALGDAHFLKGDFDGCRQNFRAAVEEGGAAGNPFVELRLGQASLELGDEEAALRHLLEAFRIGRERLFEREDGKYLSWLVERVGEE